VAWLRILTYGPAAVAIVFGALQLEAATRGRIGKALAYLGDASYSLYLVHLTVIASLPSLWRFWHGPEWAFVGLAVGIALPLSLASYEWLEKPFLRASRRAFTRSTPAFSAA
jgi:exopolysaccharide production protein ExoZ